MHYRLVTNSVDTEQVVEQTIDGDRYLIAKGVTFVRPQPLAGGYVPGDHLAESTEHWAGAPLTVNHPRDESGAVVSANTDIGEAITVGEARNPRRNPDDSLDVDLAVNADRAAGLGGEALEIVEALENGEPLEVSSQYFARPLEPGVYDGQYRDNVEGHLTPDSIALLPNAKGVCTLPDCGFDPAGTTADAATATANSESTLRVPVRANSDDAGETPTDGAETERDLRTNKSVGGISYSGTASGTLDESEIPNDDYASHYVFDADTKSDSAFPLVDGEGRLRRGNVAAAFRFRDDAPDRGDLLDVLQAVNDEFDDPPIDPDSLEEAMSSNTAGPLGSLRSFLGWGDDPTEATGNSTESDERAESRTDPDADATSMKRDNLIDEITSNSNITRESLEGMGDSCLQTTHEHIVGNDDGGTDPTGDGGDDNDDGGSDEAFEAVMTQLESLAEKTESLAEQQLTEDDVKELAANASEQSAKDDLAAEIVANSAEYEDTDAVLSDYPTEAALQTKRDSLTGGTALPGGTRATANTDDLDDVSAGVFE